MRVDNFRGRREPLSISDEGENGKDGQDTKADQRLGEFTRWQGAR